MGFHGDLYPGQFSFGTQAGPGYQTVIAESDSGQEVRRSAWTQPGQPYSARASMRYDLEQNVRTRAEVADVLRFFRARRGAAHGFRVRDDLDWSTAATHNVAFDLLNPTHRHLMVGDIQPGGSGRVWQFVKFYYDVFGPISKSFPRRITRLIRPGEDGYGIALFANGLPFYYNGLDVYGSSGLYTAIDHDAGVAITSTSLAGLTITAAFTFHVPARFDVATDGRLDIEWAEAGQFNVNGASLVGLPKDAACGPEEWYVGGFGQIDIDGQAGTWTSTANGQTTQPTSLPYLAAYWFGQFQKLVVTGTSIAGVYLPDPSVQAELYEGGPHWVFWNASAAAAIDVRLNNGGARVGLMTPGTTMEVHYVGGTQQWVAR